MTLSPVAPTDSAYGIAPSNGHLLHFPRLFGLHSQVCYLWFGSIRIFTTAGKLRDECLNGEIFYSLKELIKLHCGARFGVSVTNRKNHTLKVSEISESVSRSRREFLRSLT